MVLIPFPRRAKRSPEEILAEVQKRLFSGHLLQVEALTQDEMAAVGTLLMQGKARIGSADHQTVVLAKITEGQPARARMPRRPLRRGLFSGPDRSERP